MRMLPHLPESLPDVPTVPSKEEVLEGLLLGMQGQLDALQDDFNARCVRVSRSYLNSRTRSL